MERAVLHTEADRYVIVDYLAEGGMGAIYLGKKIGMGGFEKEVVLKQLLPEFTSQREFIDLFVREAKLSASLDHANIVHTIDFVAAGSDYFIVMEYVRGGDLRTILRRVKRRGSRLSSAGCIFIAREVLSALSYAHDKKSPNGEPLKLIHRDVSPSNIMISAVGEVKLTDFGIAKASTHKSIFYRVKGKVGYMSPEQAYGDRPLDHRSDLYSMAVVLYEMLAGERLFVADLLSTPDQIYKQPVKRLEGKNDAPRGIDAVMQKALALDPDDRYQNAGELLDGLARVAYESGQIFTATDLSGHLRDVCGDDASKWNREQDEDEIEQDGPGTQVLSGESEQFSGVQLTSVLTESELAEDDTNDEDEDGFRSTPSTPAAEAKPRKRPKSDDAATRHIKLPGARSSGSLAASSASARRERATASSPPAAADYDDEPTRHLKVKAPVPGGGADSLPEFDVGDSDMFDVSAAGEYAARSPADAFDIDEDPTTINQGLTGPLPSNMMHVGMPAPPPPTHWGESDEELTRAYAEPPPTTARGEFSVNMPQNHGAGGDFPPPAPTTPRRHRPQRVAPEGDEGYSSFPEADTDPRRRGHVAAAAAPPSAPAPEPKEAPTRLLERNNNQQQSLPPPLLAPPRQRALSPQRSNARRAQLPAPGRGSRYHRTARVAAPAAAPRANRRRNAMLFAAAFLMIAAIAIVVVVGLSGPEINPRKGSGSGGSAGGAVTTALNSGSGGSGSGSGTTVHAPVTAAVDARGAGALGDGGADAGKSAAARSDAASKSGTSVTVESSPKRAAVYLDGVRQCRAKCTVEGLDPNHTYLLSVRLRNYVPWSQLLRLGERRHVPVKAYLSEEPDPNKIGYLVINVTPPADVSVDGTRMGRVTSDGRIPLSPGQHEVKLTRNDRKPLRFLVDIKRRQITSTEKLLLK